MTDELPVPAAVVVKPDVDAAVETMRAFQALKTKLLDKDDIILIGGKQHIKRSGWRKISLAFNVSVQIVEVERSEPDGRVVVRVRAQAKAPNGRIAEDVGVCDSTEFEKGRLEPTLHNVESKAATRAINRAISDLVGGGEVSAEEIIQEEKHAPEPPKAKPIKPTTAYLLLTWKVKGENKPIPADSGPAGFLRKTVAAVESSHPGAAVTVTEEGGEIVDLRVSGLDEAAVRKDVVGPLAWVLERVFEIGKGEAEVAISNEASPVFPLSPRGTEG